MRRGQLELEAAPDVRRQLLEERPRVQRVAVGVRGEALGGPGGEALDAHRLGQRAQVAGVESAHAQAHADLARGHAPQALGQPQDVLRAGRHQHQDAVADQPPEREHERAERRHVRPLRIVDDHGHGRLALHGADQLEHPHAHRHVVGRRDGALAGAHDGGAARAADAQELVHHAVGHERLGLVAAGPQHVDVLALGQEAVDQRRLPDPLGTVDEDEPRPLRAGVGERRAQDVQLALPADERLLHGVPVLPAGTPS